MRGTKEYNSELERRFNEGGTIWLIENQNGEYYSPQFIAMSTHEGYAVLKEEVEEFWVSMRIAEEIQNKDLFRVTDSFESGVETTKAEMYST